MGNTDKEFAKIILLGVMGVAISTALRTKKPLLVKCACSGILTFEITHPVLLPVPAHLRVGELEHAYPVCVEFGRDPQSLLAYALLDRINGLAEHVPDALFQDLVSGMVKTVPGTFGARTEA